MIRHGYGEDGVCVPISDPEEVFFSDEHRTASMDADPSLEQLASKLAGERLAGTLRLIYDVLLDGPKEDAAERAVAIFRKLEIEDRGLRAIATELGVSLGSLSQKVNATLAKMNAHIERRNSGKGPKN